MNTALHQTFTPRLTNGRFPPIAKAATCAHGATRAARSVRTESHACPNGSNDRFCVATYMNWTAFHIVKTDENARGSTHVCALQNGKVAGRQTSVIAQHARQCGSGPGNSSAAGCAPTSVEPQTPLKPPLGGGWVDGWNKASREHVDDWLGRKDRYSPGQRISSWLIAVRAPVILAVLP